MIRSHTVRGKTLRGLAVLLLLTGLLAALASPARAQSSEPGLVSDTEYQSPQFDFSLEWGDPWVLTEDSIGSQDGVLDQISLESDAAFLQIILIFPTDDASAYLDVLLQSTADSGDNYEEIGTDEGDDYLSATVEFTITSQGQDLQLRKYIEVGELTASDGRTEALFTGSLLATTDEFDTSWEELLDGVDRDGRDPVFHGTPDGIAGGNNTSTSTGNDRDALEAGVNGNVYVGLNYAFFVQWDDAVWEATDAGSDATDRLVLNSDDAQITLTSYAEPGGDIKTCVTDYAETVKNSDGISGFGRATGYTLPETTDDSFGRLYDYEYTSEGKSNTFVQYLECRPLGDDAFLQLSLLTTADAYEDQVAAYEEIVGSLVYDVDISGGEPGGLDTKVGRQGDDSGTQTGTTPKEPKLTSTRYTGGAYDWSIAFDKKIWTAEELTPDDGYEGVKFTSDAVSGWIEAFDGYKGDPDACVAGTADQLTTVDSVSDVQEARRLDLPVTDRKASAALYSYTYTQDGDSLDFVEYIECRELVKGVTVLRATIITVFDDYEAQIPDIEDLLDGIEIGAGTSTTSTTTSSGGDEELEGVKGSTYTSPQFDYSLTWDESWQATATTSNEDGTALTIINGVSTVVLLGGPFPPDPVDCVDTFAGVVSGGDGVSNFAIVTNNDGEPQAGGDETFAYAFYSFTRGGVDYFDYIHCQPSPSGEYVVALIYEMPVSEIATELTAMQELLNGLTVN